MMNLTKVVCRGRPILLILLSVSMFIVSQARSDALIDSAKTSIVGKWELQSLAAWNPAFVIVERETYLADGTVSGVYSVKRNSGAKAVIYEISWKSRYFIEAPIPKLMAVSIRFEALSKSVKILSHDPLLILQAGFADCKLKPDVAIDFATYSCPQISKSISQCPNEYEIVKVSPSGLQFGAGDLQKCTAASRPTTLGPAAFSRISP